MKIVTVASLKGGSGKTSLALFMYQQISASLIVDSDPNNNSTDFMLRDVDTTELDSRNLLHLFAENRPAADLIYGGKASGDMARSVIPCTVHMHQVGSIMNGNPGALLSYGPRLKSFGQGSMPPTLW
jgi:cellulose biosynthesis protein BcsQ